MLLLPLLPPHLSIVENLSDVAVRLLESLCIELTTGHAHLLLRIDLDKSLNNPESCTHI
jgi:hypothetical protein